MGLTEGMDIAECIQDVAAGGYDDPCSFADQVDIRGEEGRGVREDLAKCRADGPAVDGGVEADSDGMFRVGAEPAGAGA
jgi:hypothetical protein